MFATEQHIITTLKALAITGVALEGEGCDRSLDEPLPRPLAERVVAMIQRDGLEASWAQDDEDRDLAWVYC